METPKSEAASHSTAHHYRSTSVVTKIEYKVFNILRRISFDSTRFNFLALLVVVLEVLQIAGVVLNSISIPHWDSFFDFRAIHHLTLQLSSNVYGFDPWTVYYAVVAFLIACCLVLLLTVFFMSETLLSSLGVVVSKGCFAFMCSFLYLPLLSVLTTSLTCFSPNDPVIFVSLFPPETCWSLPGVLVKLLSSVLIIGLFIVSLIHCTTWLFRFSYVALSLFVPLLFIRSLPFYKLQSNQKFILIISQWPAAAFTFLSNLAISSFASFSGSQSGLIILILWFVFSVLFSSLFYFLVTTHFNQKSSPPKEVPAEIPSSAPPIRSVSIGIDLDIDSSQSSTSETDHQSDHHKQSNTQNYLKFKYWFDVELYVRFLQPKPLKSISSLVDSAANIIDQGNAKFNEMVDVHLFKCNFEIFVKQNHLSFIALNSIIHNLDVDLSFRHRFLLYFYQKTTENLRRMTNTGEDYFDTKSSIIFQKNLREVKELYQDCLDALAQFWNQMTVDNPDLSKLPVITDRLRLTKLKAENLFNVLLASFPDNKELLTVYAAYCKDVKMDDELSQSIVDSIELQSSIGSEKSSSLRSSAPSRSSFGRKKKRKRGRRGFILSVASQSDHHDLVQTLSRMIFFSFGLLLVVSVLSFVFFSSTLDDVTNRALRLVESSHVLTIANKLALESRLYSLYLNSTLENSFKNQILEDAEHVMYHGNRVFISSDAFTTPRSYVCPRVNDAELSSVNDDVINSFIKDPSILVFYYRNTNPPVSEPKILNYWELVSSFTAAAVDYLNSLEVGGVVDVNRFFRFLSDNRRSLNIAGNILFTTILEAAESFFNTTRFVILFSSASSLICLVFVGIFGFYRIISKISWQRQAVLNLFLWVPSSTCQSIVDDLKSKKASGAVVDEDFSDREDQSQNSEKSENQSNLIDEVTTKVKTHLDESVNLRYPPKKFLLVLVSFSIFVLLLVLILLFSTVSKNQQDLVSTISEGLRLEDTVVELLALDFILCSRTFALVNSGDLFFYQSYWQFLNSGTREGLIESLSYDFDVSTEIQLLIGETSVYRDHILHYDKVAQVLNSQIFNFSSDLITEISNFDYDLDSETRIQHDRITFRNIINWYSNLDHDSQISVQEKFKIVRETISSDRYLEYISKSMSNLDKVLLLVSEDSDHNMDIMFSRIRGSQLLIVATVFVVFILLLLFTRMVGCFTSKILRMITYSGVALVAVALLVCLFGLYHHFDDVSTIRTNTSFVQNLVDHFSRARYMITNYRFHGDRFLTGGNLNSYNEYWNYRRNLEQELEAIQQLTLTRGTVIDDVMSRIESIYGQMKVEYGAVFKVQEIAFTIASSAYDIPINITSELIGVDWDVQQEHNFERIAVNQRNVDITNRYTNKTFDLNRTTDEKLNLSRYLVMSRSFFSILGRSFHVYLAQPNELLLSRFIEELTKLSIPSYFNIVLAILIGGGFISLVLLIVTVIVCLPQKEKVSHVKQSINLVLIQKFNTQSIISLILLGISLSAFFCHLLFEHCFSLLFSL
ncbi:hypothetical protein GEMRC1_004595 [Eukaryota sp. GEM-RC1]